jgi:Mg2+/citrate symporter
MTRATKSWLLRLVIVAAAIAAALFFLPWASPTLKAGADFLTNALGLAAWIFSALVLPLIPIALIAFVYFVWGKAYFRAWHIRRIRNTRQLREAVERGTIEQ